MGERPIHSHGRLVDLAIHPWIVNFTRELFAALDYLGDECHSKEIRTRKHLRFDGESLQEVLSKHI